MQLPSTGVTAGGWIAIIIVTLILIMGASMLTLGDEMVQAMGCIAIVIAILWFVLLMAVALRVRRRR